MMRLVKSVLPLILAGSSVACNPKQPAEFSKQQNTVQSEYAYIVGNVPEEWHYHHSGGKYSTEPVIDQNGCEMVFFLYDNNHRNKALRVNDYQPLGELDSVYFCEIKGPIGNRNYYCEKNLELTLKELDVIQKKITLPTAEALREYFKKGSVGDHINFNNHVLTEPLKAMQEKLWYKAEQ